MNQLQTIWHYLNNKKTTIGAALLLAAMVMQKLAEIWLDNIPPDWLPRLIETLQWLGGLMTGVGLSHKGVKTLTSMSPE